MKDKSCRNCHNAFKAQTDGWVMCGYWQKKWEHSGISIDEFQYEIPRNLILATGWASRTKPVCGESCFSVRGTATDGLIYNDQLLVTNSGYCANFE